MKPKIRILFVVLLVVIIGFGGWFYFKSREPAGEIRNVILISIDTCRADYLSCYGYPDRITPNIDALASEGILFRNAVCSIPITLPSHSTMLTGTIPPYHGVHDNAGYQLGDFNVTLAEILRERGFATGGIVSIFILDAKFGIAQGFDTYNDSYEEPKRDEFHGGRRADEASRLACEWLDEHKSEKFFLFLHYYDPHMPYEPPEPFASEFADNLYAGEIAYTDHHVSRVIKKLKELGIYDSTLIILTGDHGEMLGEHGEAEHGYFIYESAIKVPLIFKLPGRSKHLEVSDTVGLVDIVPTICSCLGIPTPSPVHGEDLSRYFKRKAKTHKRYIYTESLVPKKLGGNSLLGVVSGQWKYIQTTRPELYNVAKDPQEAHNLVINEPGRAHLLKENLRLILDEQVRSAGSDSKLAMDRKSREQLESLGYIGGGVDDTLEFDQSRPDPKDLIGFHQLQKEYNACLVRKQYELAKEICGEMLVERPDYIAAHYLLGKVTFKLQELDETIAHLTNFLALAATEQGKESGKEALFASNDMLAVIHFRKGNFAEATLYWSDALFIKPDQPDMHNYLGKALFRQDKFDRALAHWDKAVQLEDDNPEFHSNLAEALVRLDRANEAIEHWTKALQLKPAQAGLHNKLAEMLYQQNKLTDAVEHWNEAVKLKPDWPQVLNNLAWIYATNKDPQFYKPAEAVQLAQKACELTEYKNPVFLDTLSVSYAAAGKYTEAVETAQKALELAQSTNQQELTDEIEKRLERYKQGQP